MKILFIVVVVICAINLAECGLPSEFLEKAKAKYHDCGHTEGATDEEVETLISKKEATSHAAKCVLACVLESKGALKDNKLDPMVIGETVTKIFKNADKGNAAMEVANGCAEETDGDRCEAAWKIMQCLHQGAKDKGLAHELFTIHH